MSEEKVVVTDEKHDFRNMPVKKLIIKYTGLTLIGLLAQAIMVIFEGIIIGNGCGADGLTCVGLVMPLENLQLAIGGGFGIGLSTIAGIKLGQGDEDGARSTFNIGVCFIALLMLVLGIGLIVFPAQIATFLGTPEPYMEYMIPFIRIFGIGYPFTGIANVFAVFFNMDEKPKIGTLAMTVTAVLGVIWLYLNCFILNGGIVGCGWYYAFSVGGWAFFGWCFFGNNTKFKLNKKEFRLDWKVIGEAIKVCIPYVCIQGSTAVFTVIVNNLLAIHGNELHIAAYAIISGYVIYILNMFTQAVTGGTSPAVSYNFGEKSFGRLKEILKSNYLMNIILVAIATALFEVFASPVCWLFCGDAALVEVCEPVVRIVIACCALGSCMSIASSYFVAVYKLVPAIFTGVGRYLIFANIAMLLFVNVFGIGVDGVWYGLLVGDVLGFVCAVVCGIIESKKLTALEVKAS